MALALFLLEVNTANSLARQRVFRDRLNSLDAYNDTEFISRYRITRGIFIQLHEKIVGSLLRYTIRSTNFDSTGCITSISCHWFFPDSNCNFTWNFSIICIKVHRCCIGFTLRACKGIHYFSKPRRQLEIQQSFLEKNGFPLVLGCIDCSHIPIIAPSENEPIYVNRKNGHSINIQAICDHNLKFIDVVARWPGNTHDSFIWRQSGINQKITSGEIPIVNGWFLADSGYPLTHNLLAPLLSPNTPGERRYNRAFLKTWKNIECAFGLWKSRWRAMDKTGGTLCYTAERVCKLVISTMILHNICIKHELQLEQEVSIEIEEDVEIESYNLRQVGKKSVNQ